MGVSASIESDSATEGRSATSRLVDGLIARARIIVVGLLCIHAGLLAYSAKVHSPTWDEVGHLAAGLSHWELGRFELFSVNPPLVRTIAAAPVHFLVQPEMDWSYYRSDPSLRSEVYLGRRMIELNGRDSYRHFFIARLMLIPISLLGGLLCYFWSKELFGPVAGLIAVTLWTFSPNAIAYGSVITPDMASMVALVGCSYVFWRWMKEPSWSWGLMLGTSLSLAILVKSVWLALPLVLFAIWCVFALASRVFRRDWFTDEFSAVSSRAQFAQLACAAAVPGEGCSGTRRAL